MATCQTVFVRPLDTPQELHSIELLRITVEVSPIRFTIRLHHNLQPIDRNSTVKFVEHKPSPTALRATLKILPSPRRRNHFTKEEKDDLLRREAQERAADGKARPPLSTNPASVSARVARGLRRGRELRGLEERGQREQTKEIMAEDDDMDDVEQIPDEVMDMFIGASVQGNDDVCSDVAAEYAIRMMLDPEEPPVGTSGSEGWLEEDINRQFRFNVVNMRPGDSKHDSLETKSWLWGNSKDKPTP